MMELWPKWWNYDPKYGGYPFIRFWQFWIWQPGSSFLIYSHPGISGNIPHLWCFVNFWKTQPTPKYGGYPLIRFWQFRIWQPESSFLIYSHPGLSENIPHLWCFVNFWKLDSLDQWSQQEQKEEEQEKPLHGQTDRGLTNTGLQWPIRSEQLIYLWKENAD